MHKELSAPVDRSRPAGLRCIFLVGCGASGALQASGSAENRQWPPAGLPEGRRRQCATLDQRRTMANSMLHDAAYPLLSVPVASNYLKVYWVWRFIDFHPHNKSARSWPSMVPRSNAMKPSDVGRAGTCLCGVLSARFKNFERTDLDSDQFGSTARQRCRGYRRNCRRVKNV